MPNRFYPGDPCPSCGHPIRRGRRTIWNVFLREAYLKCSNCSSVFVRFPMGACQRAETLSTPQPADATLVPPWFMRQGP